MDKLKPIITAADVTERGNIDVLAVLRNPDHYERKVLLTARQHANRYKFAKQFVTGKKVLDIACGYGYGAVLLEPKNYSEYTGIDIDVDCIEIARTHYGTEHSNIHFYQDDARTLATTNLPENSFDLITSFETIEHFKEYDAFLDLLYKKLKPDGLLILSTPNREIVNPDKALYNAPVWKFHTQEFVQGEIEELLVKHGFKNLKVYGQSFFVPKKVTKIFRGFGRLIKNSSQKVRPMFPYKLFGKPNFLVVVAAKK